MKLSKDVPLTEGYNEGLSLREYVAIGLCSLFLAVVYVASIFLYLHWRNQRRKKTNVKIKRNDQITLGEEGTENNLSNFLRLKSIVYHKIYIVFKI